MHDFLIMYRVMLHHATLRHCRIIYCASVWTAAAAAYLLCCCDCVCSTQHNYRTSSTYYYLPSLGFFLPSNPTAKDCVTMAANEHTVVTPKQPIHAEGSLE